ncbi:MAG: ATP-dependent DNA helicase RecG [Actinomycetota bacterium]
MPSTTKSRVVGEVVPPRPTGLELFGQGPRARDLKVTAARMAALEKMGITSVQDLLQHYPRRHVDRTKLHTIAEIARAVGEEDTPDEIQIHATVQTMGRPFQLPSKKGQKKRRTLIKGRIKDETGAIDVTWFNQDWIAKKLSPGTQGFFYGRLATFRGKLQMTSPRFELVKTGAEPFNVGRIIPIYPATADMPSDQIRRLMWETFEKVGEILDPVPEDVRGRFHLISRNEALHKIHFPDDPDDVFAARNRIVFDEVFTLQLGLVYRKRKLELSVRGIPHPAPEADSLGETFVSALPFELTTAQKQACREVASDMTKSYPMHRLVEGEVGSGKTVVAVYACLISIQGKRQAAIMAPTEVLAEQHHLTVNELLDRAFGADEARNLFAHVSRRPVVRLLTGSTAAAQREEILSGIANGDIDLVIGTHALIQEQVAFKDLGLAVVDEQHRFGVHQRKALMDKNGDAGGAPDILVMTATPIPRSLAVTIYGDLDVSILDELPKGRRPITTSIAADERARDAAYDLIRAEVAEGRQAFVVYALRDESDKVELRSAKGEAKRLATEVFPDLKVGLVHGDMKSAEKEGAMTAFRDGGTNVLVATTVIEVGVDVPNATVMLIEDADRFGLAQLHQLRGRIGRGEHPSYCVLATNVDLDASKDDPAIASVAERLLAVESTVDGFKLAEVDLKQRGEGQLFGARQSGMPQLKLVRVLQHQDVIKKARDLATEIIDEDPELHAYENTWLRAEMTDRFPPGALEVVQSG